MMRGSGGAAARRDTIVAVSSPPGSGAVSLLRLSGPDAEHIAASVLRTSTGPAAFTDRRAIVVHLVDPADASVIDQGLATVFRAPRSYTGETLVEIGLHGNEVIVAEALRLLCLAGARMAEPGEFTRRAFSNARLDLTRAEAVLDVISAESLDAVKQAQRQLSGELETRFIELQGKLADVLGMIEATLEFPDDLEENSDRALNSARERLDEAQQEVHRLLESFERGARVLGGSSVALVGRPNVGKSSIFNELCGSDRAIVTPVAGTTRDALEARVRLGGRLIRLVDTAGITDSQDPIEKQGVARARRSLDEADRLLFVLDASQALDAEDRELARELAHRSGWVLTNKVDLGDRLDDLELDELLPGWPRLSISAKTGQGLEALEQAMACELDRLPATESVPISSERQRGELDRVRENAAFAMTHLRDQCEELAAEELRSALVILACVVGSVTDEDVLDRIFAKFCIGK